MGRQGQGGSQTGSPPGSRQPPRSVGTWSRAGQAGLCVEGHSWWVTGRQAITRGLHPDREARPLVRAEKSSIQAARAEGR